MRGVVQSPQVTINKAVVDAVTQKMAAATTVFVPPTLKVVEFADGSFGAVRSYNAPTDSGAGGPASAFANVSGLSTNNEGSSSFVNLTAATYDNSSFSSANVGVEAASPSVFVSTDSVWG